MNIKENKFKYIMIFLGALLVIIILLITNGKENGSKATISNGVDVPIMPTKSDEKPSEDTIDDGSSVAVVLDIDTKALTMLLKDLDTQTKITYNYTGGTDIVNRYGEIISVTQLKIGEVVEVKYESNKKLSSIKISESDWEYLGVTNFKLDTDKKVLTIGDEKYSYTDNIVIINEDRETTIDKLENIDVLTLKGRDKQIDSIIVTTGHGYVRLDGTTFFEGGYVEIGQKIVQLITENMVIPVPTGNYTLMVTKDKTSGSKEITVGNNEEIRVNLTEFQSDAVRLGTLSFKINPSGAKLTIDGVVKDYSEIIDVAFGTHKVVISADGYEPYSQIINVEDIFKEYDITLTEAAETSATEKETESTTSKTTSSNNSTTKQTTTSQTIDYNSLVDALFGN